MKLTTPVTLPVAPFKIGVNDRVLVVGSCFAEHTAAKLASAATIGYTIYSNPFGVLYNPLSIARCVSILRRGEQFAESDLVERDGLWHSLDFHGSFSAPTSGEVLSRINRQAVGQLDVIIVTLGTAYVYFREGRVVANCHKLPEREFSRRRISVDEAVGALNHLAQLYPDAKFVCSLSPIRHLRDGLIENSASKAILRLALDQFCAAAPKERFYFPAYEMMNDELRDYRFTEVDMCHPTLQARDYIWEKFASLMLCDELQAQVVEGQRAARAAAHRSLR